MDEHDLNFARKVGKHLAEAARQQPAQPAPEPAEVELIASGYEWTCPQEGCEYIENKEIEITETVTCKKCGTTYKVNDYHHAHG